jgi:hypothetical protein
VQIAEGQQRAGRKSIEESEPRAAVADIHKLTALMVFTDYCAQLRLGRGALVSITHEDFSRTQLNGVLA